MSDRRDGIAGPPTDLEAEQAVIGAVLFDPGATVRACKLLDWSDFYLEAHQRIFKAVQAVRDNGSPVDMITVGAQLRLLDQLEDSGGPEYLDACVLNRLTTTRHIIPFSEILLDRAAKRKLATAGADIQQAALANPEDLGELVRFALDSVMDVGRSIMRGAGAQPTSETADELNVRLEDALVAPPFVTAARTGMPILDKKMGGLGHHRLVVPRAQEKGLKSRFAQQCSLSSARAFRDEGKGRSVVVYILEDVETWEERALGWLGSFNSSIFEPWMSATATDIERYQSAMAEYETLDLLLTGKAHDFSLIAADLRMLKVEHDIGLVCVDYAQLLRGSSEQNQTLRLEEYAREMQDLARELKCPIIVPSQVSEGEGGERKSKWARGWDECATLVFDIQRGNEGDARHVWQASWVGALVMHACRRQPPFSKYQFQVDLGTGHFSDGAQYSESAHDARNY